MKLEQAKKIINENYDDYASAIFKITAMVKSLRKTYDDHTIILAFQEVMKKKFKK